MSELLGSSPAGIVTLDWCHLIDALRVYLADGTQRVASWLSALADKRICAALTRMHQEPLVHGLSRYSPTLPACREQRLPKLSNGCG